jgi:hypothetical protein
VQDPSRMAILSTNIRPNGHGYGWLIMPTDFMGGYATTHGWAWVEVLIHGYPIDIQLICGSHMSVRHGILPRPSCPFVEAKITKGPLKLRCNPQLPVLSCPPPPLGGLDRRPSLPPLRKSGSPPPRRRTGGQWACSHHISLLPPPVHFSHNYC